MARRMLHDARRLAEYWEQRANNLHDRLAAELAKKYPMKRIKR